MDIDNEDMYEGTDHKQVEVLHPLEGLIEVDEGLKELLLLLWSKGHETYFSCEGESKYKDQTVWSNKVDGCQAYILMPRTDVNFELVIHVLQNFPAFKNNRKILWDVSFDKHKYWGNRICLRFPKSDIPKLHSFLMSY